MPSKSSPKQNSSSIRRLAYNHEKFIIIVFVLVVLVLFDLFTPIMGGQIRYYTNWISCGQRPEQEKSDFGGHIEYHEKSSIVSLMRDNRTKYYCTAREAELGGLSNESTTYSFPHITNEERRDRVNGHRRWLEQ